MTHELVVSGLSARYGRVRAVESLVRGAEGEA